MAYPAARPFEIVQRQSADWFRSDGPVSEIIDGLEVVSTDQALERVGESLRIVSIGLDEKKPPVRDVLAGRHVFWRRLGIEREKAGQVNALRPLLRLGNLLAQANLLI